MKDKLKKFYQDHRDGVIIGTMATLGLGIIAVSHNLLGDRYPMSGETIIDRDDNIVGFILENGNTYLFDNNPK